MLQDKNPGNRSLGGIGRLYDGDTFIGEVYYSIRQEEPDGPIRGSIVFLGSEAPLAGDNRPYRLLLEDKRPLVLTLSKDPNARFAPYSFTSHDAILLRPSSGNSR